MGISWKNLKLRLEILIQQRVMTNFTIKMLQLLLIRQLPLNQQVAHLIECGILRQIRNIVTTVPKNALLTINISDLRLRRTGRNIARVERNKIGFGQHVSQHHTTITLGGPNDVHLILAARIMQHGLLIIGSHSFPF